MRDVVAADLCPKVRDRLFDVFRAISAEQQLELRRPEDQAAIIDILPGVRIVICGARRLVSVDLPRRVLEVENRSVIHEEHAGVPGLQPSDQLKKVVRVFPGFIVAAPDRGDMVAPELLDRDPGFHDLVESSIMIAVCVGTDCEIDLFDLVGF